MDSELEETILSAINEGVDWVTSDKDFNEESMDSEEVKKAVWGCVTVILKEKNQYSKIKQQGNPETLYNRVARENEHSIELSGKLVE